jgi:Holliday junction resolvase RusA-like endonuclease
MLARWPVTILVDGMTPPSGNAFERGGMFGNHHAKTKLRNIWQQLLAVQLDARRDGEKRMLMAAAEEKVPMKISILVRHRRLFDYDNLVRGCKPVIDCLTRLGWIADDSPALLAVDYAQEQSRKELTLITIQPKGFTP